MIRIRGNRTEVCTACGVVRGRAHEKDCVSVVTMTPAQWKTVRLPPQRS